jgi:hypothetical protein
VDDDYWLTAGDDTVLPDRSADETDAYWGGRPDTDTDDRLRRDRPPHWED